MAAGVDLKAMHPIQLEVQSKLLKVLRTSDAERAILTLTTGAGPGIWPEGVFINPGNYRTRV